MTTTTLSPPDVRRGTTWTVTIRALSPDNVFDDVRRAAITAMAEHDGVTIPVIIDPVLTPGQVDEVITGHRQAVAVAHAITTWAQDTMPGVGIVAEPHISTNTGWINRWGRYAANFTITRDGTPGVLACGHAPNATDTTGRPVCAIDAGLTPGWDIPAPSPALDDRAATCHCGRTVPSSTSLAFFQSRPDRDTDTFYCGCRGWD